VSALAPARVRPPVQRSEPGQTSQSRQPSTPDRARLSVVSAARATAGRTPFVVLVVGVLAVGLLGLLMLHTLAAQDAFRLHDLQRQAAALGDTEQQLAVADQQLQAPTSLADRAHALGMVPTGALAFVRLHGRTVGVATAVPVARPAPAATPTPSATAAGRNSAAKAPTARKSPAGAAQKPAGRRPGPTPTTSPPATTRP
jgi:hypothetical protein